MQIAYPCLAKEGEKKNKKKFGVWNARTDRSRRVVTERFFTIHIVSLIQSRTEPSKLLLGTTIFVTGGEIFYASLTKKGKPENDQKVIVQNDQTWPERSTRQG